MRKLQLGLLLLATFLLSSCGGEDNPSTGNQGRSIEWSIPASEVFDGGVGQDGIPSINQPNFSSVGQINFLSDDDLVVGVIINGVAKAYPHEILDWHEIVNDEIGGMSVAITYCPLTGTAVGWDRTVNGQNVSFGVSGKLFNTNLIPFDRTTNSYWSQLGLNCVNGEWINTEINFVPMIETSWATWKSAYPDSEVLNTETGISRPYGEYPYGDYITNHDNIFFPVSPLDQRLPSKERVLGVIGDSMDVAYRLATFREDQVITDHLEEKELLIIGSQSNNFIVAYENNLGLTGVTSVPNSLPVIAQSSDGNMITMDGQIIEGPLAGQSLSSTKSWIGYWMSFGSFYPGIGIYE